MSYKPTAELSSMPVNFLFNLLKVSRNPEWVMAVIDLLLEDPNMEEQNTELVLMIQDKINKDVFTQTTTSYHVERSITGQTAQYTFPSGNPSIHTTVRTTYTNTVTVFIQKANTWCMDFEQEAVPNNTQILGEDIIIPAKEYSSSDYSNLNYGANNVSEEKLLHSTKERIDVWDYSWTINITTEKKINYEKFLGLWKNSTGRYVKGGKYDPNGKLVGYPSTTDENAFKYPVDDIAQEQWQNIEELIYILGNHQDTQMHEVLMMYYWNIYFGEDVYDIDIEALLGLFNTDVFLSFGGSSHSGGFVVKADEPNTAPILTEEQLDEALGNWLSGEKLSNARRVLATVKSCEGTWKINSVFTYALMMQECSMGTADTSWVRENNWTSLVGYRTYTISFS